MSLKVNMRKMIRAEVVPWEIADGAGEEDLYGIAYMTADGWEDSEPVGTKAEAEKLVQEIAGQKVVALNASVNRG